MSLAVQDRGKWRIRNPVKAGKETVQEEREDGKRSKEEGRKMDWN